MAKKTPKQAIIAYVLHPAPKKCQDDKQTEKGNEH
jgi:hypothetical protein